LDHEVCGPETVPFVASDRKPDLHSIWGRSDDDVWVVGRELLRHWDGCRWEARSLGLLTTNDQFFKSVRGTDKGEIWVMSSNGKIRRLDGEVLSDSDYNGGGSRTDLKALWIGDDADAWAVGAGGLIVHWDGQRWTEVASATTMTLNAVWGSGPSDVWAVGGIAHERGVILHWDGLSWSDTGVVTPTGLFGIWGTSSNDIWAVGGDRAPASPFGDAEGRALHWDGQAWTRTSTGTLSILAITGAASDDVWIASLDRKLVRWDGQTWRVEGLTDAIPFAMWRSPSGALWVAGDSGRVEIIPRSQP
jgi:hypothetical protein